MVDVCSDCQSFDAFTLTTDVADVTGKMGRPTDGDTLVTIIAAISINGNGFRSCSLRGIGSGCLVCPVGEFMPRSIVQSNN